MKIDQDLRAAIRSAEKAQPDVSNYEIRERAKTRAIEDFLKRCPSKAKHVAGLVASIQKGEKMASDASKELCAKFGLRRYDNKLQFSRCGDGGDAFVKAGGKLPPDRVPGEKWKFDHVIAELAAAEPKDLKRILKKYGINWS